MPEAGPSGTNHEPPPAEPPAAPLPVPPLPVSHPPEQITDPLELALLPVSVPDTSEQLKTYVNNLVRLTILTVPSSVQFRMPPGCAPSDPSSALAG